jgi:hypothetical protein
MALAHQTINPLNVLGIRKLKFIPAHFAKINIQSYEYSNIQKIDNWIYTCLNGRYSISRSFKKIDGIAAELFNIGFEDPTEVSIFYLSCPYYKT